MHDDDQVFPMPDERAKKTLALLPAEKKAEKTGCGGRWSAVVEGILGSSYVQLNMGSVPSMMLRSREVCNKLCSVLLGRRVRRGMNWKLGFPDRRCCAE